MPHPIRVSCLLAAGALFGASVFSQSDAPQTAPSSVAAPTSAAAAGAAAKLEPLPPGIDARCLDTSITTDELAKLLVDRFGLAQSGRSVLEQLVQRKVVAELAARANLQPAETAVDARMAEIDAAARQSGAKNGIADHLKRNRLELSFFRAMLRLGLQQEGLTRAALGLGPDDKVSGAQQDTWLAQVMKERGIELMPLPWQDIVAKSGGAFVSPAEFGLALRRELPISDVAEACFQAVLLRRLEARMTDAARHAFEPALDEALQRRRSDVERNPKYKGLSWAQYLQSQGFDEASFRRDPALRIEAYTHALVDTTHDDAALRKVYDAERDYFEGRYGESVRTGLMYIGAKSYMKALRDADKTSTDKQVFEQALSTAHEELQRVASAITTEDDFRKRAALVNDDDALKRAEGDLGWVTRADPRLPQEMRDAVWNNAPPLSAPGAASTPNASTPDASTSGAKTDATAPAAVPDAARPVESALGTASAGHLVGPLKMPGGSALLWLGERRPSPAWDEMKARVHAELRRRVIEDIVPRNSLRTFLDTNPAQ